MICLKATDVFLQNTHDLLSCQFPTHLSLTCSKFHVDDSVFNALSKAYQEGKIPNLSHLSFARLKEDIKNKLYLLFQTPWSKLTHLDLSVCKLDKNDVQIVLGGIDPGQENLLPVLSSLAIELCHFKIVDQGKLFTEQWTSLTTLDLSNSYSGYFPTSKLIDTVNNSLVPNLTTLKLWNYRLSQLQPTPNTFGSKLKLSSFALTGTSSMRGSVDLKNFVKQNFITRWSHRLPNPKHLVFVKMRYSQ